MKNIITALTLGFTSTLINAEAIATMPNQAQGKIVLTNEVCKYKGKTYSALNRAYNYTSEGYSREGCYHLEDETVVVIWKMDNEAKQMRYPVENFTLIKRNNTSGGTQI